MNSELYDDIINTLKDRVEWENDQARAMQLRLQGPTRSKKPFKGSSTLHFPIIDMMIGKIKPFLEQQLYVSEQLANIRSIHPNDTADAMALGHWYNYRLFEYSNFETEMEHMFDQVLFYGSAIVKSYYDVSKKQCRFKTIDQLYTICPKSTENIEDADYFVHIQRYTLKKYQRNKSFNQDPDLVKKISGDFDDNVNGLNDKYTRAGITHGINDKEIIIWEIYENCGDSWKVHWISPKAPKEKIKPSIKQIPYQHKSLPFVQFKWEQTEKGYYNCRGAYLILRQFEVYCSKLMTTKSDAMTLSNMPIYTPRTPLSGGEDRLIKITPGTVTPFPIDRVNQGTPPFSYEQEMANTRNIAEQVFSVPDLGMSNPNGQKRTASEVNTITSMMNTGISSKNRKILKVLNKLLALDFQLRLEMESKELDYQFQSQNQNITKSLTNDSFQNKNNLRLKIKLSGDGYNKEAIYNRRLNQYNQLKDNPYVNQAELTKALIEADDPLNVNNIFVAPKEQGIEQKEIQANELTRLLIIGTPMTVSESDKHDIHIQVLIEFIEKKAVEKALDENLAIALFDHVNNHYIALKDIDNDLAQKVKPILDQVGNILNPYLQNAVDSNMNPHQMQND